MPRLVYSTKSGPPQTFSIKKKLITIGRAKGNDIILDSSEISQHHANIICDASGYTISIMDSKQQFLINSKPKKISHLKPDDIITIGSWNIVFRMDDTPAVKPSEQKYNEQKENSNPSFQHLFSLLKSFSEKLVEKLSSQDLFRILLDQIIELTKADSGFLVQILEDKWEIPVARNIQKKDLLKSLDKVSDSIIKKVIETQEGIVVSDAIQDDRFGTSQSVVDLQLSSVMCVPLKFRNQLLGILYLGNNRIANLFKENDLEQLKVFASQASLILYNAQLMNELKIDNQTLREELKNASLGRIIGQSDGMKLISKTIDKIANADISVLIIGETGTGKELIAKELHTRSSRKDKPFISINCGAIPENLLESELFGHIKGAFTGATSNRVGKFEAAEGGTIFLDEIGEMPLSLQVKLLRVLQERVIDKLGESNPVPINVRIVSATNKDLEQSIKDKIFREDLFYRLNEIRLLVPPLRERGEDIILIGKYLLDKYAQRYPQSKVKGFSKEAITLMIRYYWPGNVRQLENKIKKAVVMSEETLITPEDLELNTSQNTSKILSLSEAQSEFTIKYIKQILEINNWNKTKTAKDLDVDPRTIFRYMDKIDP